MMRSSVLLLLLLTMMMMTGLVTAKIKVQVIPGLLSLKDHRGSILAQPEVCSNNWTATLMLADYNMTCKMLCQCQNYETIGGHMLYFQTQSFPIVGSFSEIKRRFIDRISWFKMSVDEQKRPGLSYQFLFPVHLANFSMLAMNEEDGMLLSQDYEATSIKEGVLGSLVYSLFVNCEQGFGGENCQDLVDSQPDEDAPTDTCQGAMEFVIESHQLVGDRSRNEALFAADSNNGTASPSSSASSSSASTSSFASSTCPESSDWMANKPLILLLLCILSIVATVELVLLVVTYHRYVNRKKFPEQSPASQQIYAQRIVV